MDIAQIQKLLPLSMEVTKIQQQAGPKLIKSRLVSIARELGIFQLLGMDLMVVVPIPLGHMDQDTVLANTLVVILVSIGDRW